MKKKTKHGKLYYSLQLICTLPFLCYSLVILWVGMVSFTNKMHMEIQDELTYVTQLSKTIIDEKYPGDYRLVGDKQLALYKGETDITREYELLDNIKQQTGMDLTLFYQDTRILTTIYDWSNNRLVGTRGPQIMLDEVLAKDEAHFYTKTIINGQPYFAYYQPLHNSDGTLVGALFVGKPSRQVHQMTQRAVYPLLAVGIITMLAVELISLMQSKKLFSSMEEIKRFLSGIADGNLHEKIDPDILERRDELTDMALSAQSMQFSLRKLIEKDALTEIYNRRSGIYYLEETMKKSKAKGEPFSVVLGDIDHFKKVNDTYGHEAGDIVLKNIAYQLYRATRGKGCAIRWGGEEFLLVLEKCDLEQAEKLMNETLGKVRSTVNIAGEHEILVTMTFGIVCDPDLDMKTLVSQADKKLYYGKEHGRNQIVTILPVEEEPAETEEAPAKEPMTEEISVAEILTGKPAEDESDME